jgi:hypothetical protein
LNVPLETALVKSVKGTPAFNPNVIGCARAEAAAKTSRNRGLIKSGYERGRVGVADQTVAIVLLAAIPTVEGRIPKTVRISSKWRLIP